MIDNSRKQFERREILITLHQEQAIQTDADARYPELITAKGRRRNFSPAIRDIIDFWMAHPTFFSSWIASRSDSPRENKSS